MTRINLVDPAVLSDQHLFAEFREIKMIAPALGRSIQAQEGNLDKVLKRIPREFTLNTGHVMFFYDKVAFLHDRFNLLRDELDDRGVNYDWLNAHLDKDHIFDTVDDRFYNNYVADEKSILISKQRIIIRIDEQPEWYRFRGEANMFYNKPTLDEATQLAISKSYVYGVTWEVRKINDTSYQVIPEVWSDKGTLIWAYRNGKQVYPPTGDEQ